MGPAANFPSEVWFRIADFIPRSDLVKLYSVNAAFFYVSMNERYREASVYDLNDWETVKIASRLNSPAVANRVLTLNLRPHLFGPYLPKSFSPGQLNNISVAELLWFFRRRLQRTITAPPYSAAAHIILKNICGMPNINSLKIQCISSDSIPNFIRAIPLIDVAWLRHKRQLQSLTIAVPSQTLPAVLPSTLILEKLENFSISGTSAGNQPETTVILHFLQRHSNTLKCLSADTIFLDPSSVLGHLQLPRLINLSICLPSLVLRHTVPTWVEYIMSQQSSTLLKLKLVFNGHSAPTNMHFAHPIFGVVLTKLEVFDLTLPKMESVLPDLKSYLLRLYPSLKTLVIRGKVFSSVDDVKLVVSGPNESPNFNLRRLQIHVFHLSPLFFDMLSQQVPGLRQLSIDFDFLFGGDFRDTECFYYKPVTSDVFKFVLDMQQRDYRGWNLVELDLLGIPECKSNDSEEYLRAWFECRKILVASFPSVISFNGLSGSEFIQSDGVYQPGVV